MEYIKRSLGSFTASAINNCGDVTGYNTRGQGVVMSNEGVVVFGNLQTQPLDINDHGLVVGRTGNTAFVWDGNNLTDLGPGCAHSVNNLGEVCGVTVDATGQSFATIWKLGEVMWQSDQPSVALSINDNSITVGWQKDVSGIMVPTLWESGTSHYLPMPPGITSGVATGINARGVIIGHTQRQTHFTGLTWTSEGVQMLTNPKWMLSCMPRQINNKGLIVGTTDKEDLFLPGKRRDNGAFVLRDGVMFDLDTLCMELSFLQGVVGVNDEGAILSNENGFASMLVPAETSYSRFTFENNGPLTTLKGRIATLFGMS